MTDVVLSSLPMSTSLDHRHSLLQCHCDSTTLCWVNAVFKQWKLGSMEH